MHSTELLTIGEFAKLHEINKKTLMWYDEIGLLKPALIKENGYRYYSYHQSSILETILILKELNVSLNEIKQFLNNRSAEHLEILLKEKITELDTTLAHLFHIKDVLTARQKAMHTLAHIDLSKISVIEKDNCYLVTVPTSKEDDMEKAIKKVMTEAKKYQLHRLHDTAYGSMIAVDNLYKSDFQNYSSLFIELQKPQKKKGLHIQPKGKYLRAYCKGNWNKLPEKYQEILDYAKSHGLVLSGFAYEISINELVSDSIDDYITQIEIPILSE